MSLTGSVSLAMRRTDPWPCCTKLGRRVGSGHERTEEAQALYFFMKPFEVSPVSGDRSTCAPVHTGSGPAAQGGVNATQTSGNTTVEFNDTRTRAKELQ